MIVANLNGGEVTTLEGLLGKVRASGPREGFAGFFPKINQHPHFSDKLRNPQRGVFFAKIKGILPAVALFGSGRL